MKIDMEMAKSHVIDCDTAEKAELLATLINSVPTEERYLLYQIAATHLAKVGQNYQAHHFRELAYHERGK